MSKRIWLGLILVLALALGACVAPSAPSGAAPAAGATPAAGTAGASEIHVAYPYAVPPTGHFNTWVTNGMALGIYQDLMEPPLFLYMWSDASWMPLAGKSWKWVNDTTLEVELPQGAVWSDGSAYTSKDVVDTFAIARLLNQAVWRYITDVKAVDDHTVDFILKEPSTTVPRRVLRDTYIHASSVYGDWAQKVNDLVAQGKTPDDDVWKTLLQQFNEFRPKDMVVLGPYKIDPASITESQMILNKVPTSFMANMVKFDRMVNYNGETPTITPLVLSKDVDYATHGFPPATEKQFVSEGIRIIRAPLYTGPALFFNMKVHPFEMKEVRQAIAYALDRDQNATVSLGDSAKRQMYMTGFSDNLVPLVDQPRCSGQTKPI